VQQLEAEIGVPLFIRQRPHIVLTEAGTAFLERAKELIRASHFAMEEAEQVEAGLAGAVTVGFVSQIVFETLPKILKKFRARVPSASFKLRELSAAEQIAALEERTIDFALIQSASSPKGFESAVLLRERFAIVHSLQHRLAKESTAGLKDFSEDVLFLPHRDESANLRETILANFARHGGPPARIEEVE
jgi:DNA-binding transcriptional LysR family regulator